ncbi:MAG TPA: peptidoglycan DD-metalloendopeptidase family protein [Gammaproteobacteria bacterium]
MRRHQTPQRVLLLCLSLMLGSLLSGCVNLSERWDMQAYTVSRGDTLYSIAWRYEKDFRDIARWNDISPPYEIYVGQRLVMQPVSQDGTLSRGDRPQVLIDSATGLSIEEAPARSAQASVPVAGKRDQVVVSKNDTLYGIARREGLSHHQIARWNHLRAPYLLKPGQTLRLTPPPSSMASSQSAASVTTSPVVNSTPTATPIKDSPVQRPRVAASQVQPPAKLPATVASWQWPASGQVVQTFKADDTSRKGIGIKGRAGQAVKAAAAGSVVYSGNGLINYGNLVIIKHSHAFLSAYAYNRELLVKEGDVVKQGQAIARMGDASQHDQHLHFEIRRNGKPVNPLNYLPKS